MYKGLGKSQLHSKHPTNVVYCYYFFRVQSVNKKFISCKCTGIEEGVQREKGVGEYLIM